MATSAFTRQAWTADETVSLLKIGVCVSDRFKLKLEKAFHAVMAWMIPSKRHSQREEGLTSPFSG
jgi:hypothetical protein